MQICKTIHAKTPASKSSARIPQPAGYFSSLRIGQGLEISNNRNSTNPTNAVLIRAISYVLVHLFGFSLTLFRSYCVVWCYPVPLSGLAKD